MNKITGNRCFDTDKQRDLLLKALKGENNAADSLAEMIGSDVNDIKAAVSTLIDIIKKEADKNSISFVDAIDKL